MGEDWKSFDVPARSMDVKGHLVRSHVKMKNMWLETGGKAIIIIK